MAETGNTKPLPWRYCECGCKGFSLTLATQHYWTGDLDGGKTYLGVGHGWVLSKEIGRYNSQADVDHAVRKHARPFLAAARQQLERAEAEVN